MKKFYLFAVALILSANIFAGVTCTIDSASTGFFKPGPDSLPCIERNTPYFQVIQIHVPVSMNLQDFGSPIPYILQVDSVIITGVNGLPAGIGYQSNPYNGKLYGGQRGCAAVSGTTSSPAGNYPITFNGTITMHGTPFPGIFDGDTTVSFADVAGQGGDLFKMYVDVIEPGQPCVHTTASAIGDLNVDLNSVFSVYPNPTNGIVQVELNTGGRVNGELNVMDAMGRTVFSQKVDVAGTFNTPVDLSSLPKGIYNLQIRTTEGFAGKSISVE